MLYLLIPIIFLIALVWLIIKIKLIRNYKIILSVISFFAFFGFFLLWTMLYAVIGERSFKPRLGHYLISKFSEPYDIIGRLTLNDKFEIYPKNKENKMIGIYKDGKLYTGSLENGIIAPIDGNSFTESKGQVINLQSLLLGRDRFE